MKIKIVYDISDFRIAVRKKPKRFIAIVYQYICVKTKENKEGVACFVSFINKGAEEIFNEKKSEKWSQVKRVNGDVTDICYSYSGDSEVVVAELKRLVERKGEMIKSVIKYSLLVFVVFLFVLSPTVYVTYGIWWLGGTLGLSALFLFGSFWMEHNRMKGLFRTCEIGPFCML